MLEKFNFGPKLIKWITILYHDLTTCIIVKTMYLTKNSGGLDIINIEYKLYTLRLQLCLIMLNQNTHTYIESLVKYVVSVIDYNISLFRTASRSNLHNDTACFYRYF